MNAREEMIFRRIVTLINETRCWAELLQAEHQTAEALPTLRDLSLLELELDHATGETGPC